MELHTKIRKWSLCVLGVCVWKFEADEDEHEHEHTKMKSQIVCSFICKIKANEDEVEHTRTLVFSSLISSRFHQVFELEFKGFEFTEFLCSSLRILSLSDSYAHLILGF